LRSDIVFVDFPELLAKSMYFHANHGVLCRGKAIGRTPEDLGGNVELGELFLLLLKVLPAGVFQESCVSSASAEKLDGTLQFLPLSVPYIHSDEFRIPGLYGGVDAV
jgi:hypothetical protein